ncbi:hypothetical protein ACUNWD_04145 [Sunxiuqinia sp. A32]|uniref:hypothetical protein n=1 Tax=Sunxiuqinia sp. A32 TaxID=3461496 RepID=UPI00404601C8
MSSAGHVADMMVRMKANRELRKRSNPFKKEEDKIYEGKHIQLKFRKVSPQQKRFFQLKINRENEKRIIFERIGTIAFVVLFIIGFIWLVGFMTTPT